MTALKPVRRSLITGVAGFAGPYLAQALIAADESVAGYVHAAAVAVDRRLTGVELYEGDIRDAERLQQVLDEVRPEYIYHLAGKSHVGRSWGRQQLYFEINALGTVALLQAVVAAAPDARVVLASTGEVYGRSEAAAVPIDEQRPLRPLSPYAASKLCAEIAARQASDAEQVHVVTARPFNFAGPGQDSSFVCSDFARQVARAEAGLSEPVIAVGNLDVVRDFADVRDIARGFVRGAHAGVSGEAYNLCSGTPVSIRQILEQIVGLARCAIEIRVDPDRFRPADVPRFVGDASRAARELDWRAEIPLPTTLADTLDHWRRLYAGEAHA